MEILHTLGIDWALLIAQCVNFAVILFLLSKFVYKPLLRTIDTRREIAKRAMDDAQAIESEKRLIEQQRQEILRRTDEEAGAMLERAKMEAERMHKDIVESAHREARLLLERGEKQLAAERAQVFAETQDTLAETIISFTEKILRREFTDADQDRLLKELEKNLPHAFAR